ncbi:hypothetical protein MMC24_004803 [Lignoscripta atroalba]|nr:hypothetical protein [Lignoscripta atroalba]
MAILKGLEAAVVVNGHELIEYEDDGSDEPGASNTVTKYVEAVSGAEFEVILSSENQINNRHEDIKAHVAKLGEILIKARRVKRRCSVAYSNSKSKVGILESLDVLPEKALKGQALSHRASLGAPQKGAPRTRFHCDYIDEANSPFAVFKFKYRSRKALEDTCIIPRSVTPVPLEDRPLDQLTREEAVELLRWRSVKPETKPLDQTRIRLKRERDPEYDELMASARTTKGPRLERERDPEYDELMASARTTKGPRLSQACGGGLVLARVAGDRKSSWGDSVAFLYPLQQRLRSIAQHLGRG